jgi:hypothetical protein
MVTDETVKNIPPVERWTYMMENCPQEQALWLRELAMECQAAAQDQDPQNWGGHLGIAWGGYLEIAKRVLRRRGIPYRESQTSDRLTSQIRSDNREPIQNSPHKAI